MMKIVCIERKCCEQIVFSRVVERCGSTTYHGGFQINPEVVSSPLECVAMPNRSNVVEARTVRDRSTYVVEART